VNWVLKNPDYRYVIFLRRKIENPAEQIDTTQILETVEAPDLDQAIAAAHALLDKYAEQAGEYGLEIWLQCPQLPHPDQERLGIWHYKLSPEARKQARAIRMRGRDIEMRIAAMVRHAAPFEHRTANLRFGGIIMRVQDDTVTWIGLAVPRRRRKRSTRKAKGLSGRRACGARRLHPAQRLLNACRYLQAGRRNSPLRRLSLARPSDIDAERLQLTAGQAVANSARTRGKADL
jgi:hypothetical protein